MILLTRSVALLTVLLALALMAVSVYAARSQPPLSAASEESASESLLSYSAAPANAHSPSTEGAAIATKISELSITPTPTFQPRYAAPVSAAAVGPVRSSRGNLSPGVRVWRVPSIQPRSASRLEVPGGGLDIPLEQLAVMQQVSLWTDIPWQIFAAIAKVESNLGRNMAVSSAGAIGYGQFMPESWARVGNGGDPYDFRDALPAMGRYLIAAGAPNDLRGAIYSYNHSLEYVADVLSIAAGYGYQVSGPGPQAASDGLIWPVIGAISSQFTDDHQAVDVGQATTPNAPVRAAHNGVVVFAGGDPCCSYGLYVLVVGPSGITTLYAHLAALQVTPGQTVLQGQSLGPVGCTGNCSGPHLHFEVVVEGTRRDPLRYLP